MEYPIRLNKYLAHTGVASRREADALIEAGKVVINGQRAVIGQQVHEGDKVETVGNKPRKRYYAYYKGRGIITHSPAEHETDIATKLKDQHSLDGISPVGRLDKDSEGLMVLTDDGRLTGPLLDPESGHEKQYEVEVDKPIGGSFMKDMERGVNIEGYVTKAAIVEKKTTHRFLLTITEGKKHQIRRMCAALGYQVQSLKRVRILHIKLGLLKPNQYRKIAGEELKELLKVLGIK